MHVDPHQAFQRFAKQVEQACAAHGINPSHHRPKSQACYLSLKSLNPYGLQSDRAQLNQATMDFRILVYVPLPSYGLL